MDISCGMELQFSEASNLTEPDFSSAGTGLAVNLESSTDDVRHLLDGVSSTCTSTTCRGHFQSDRHLSASDFKLDLGPANDLVSVTDLSMENSVTDISDSLMISEECSDGYSIVNAALEGNVTPLKPQGSSPCTLNLNGIPLTTVLSNIQAIPVIPLTNLQNIQLNSDGKIIKLNGLQVISNNDKLPGDSKASTPNMGQSAVLLGNVLMLHSMANQTGNAGQVKTIADTMDQNNSRGPGTTFRGVDIGLPNSSSSGNVMSVIPLQSTCVKNQNISVIKTPASRSGVKATRSDLGSDSLPVMEKSLLMRETATTNNLSFPDSTTPSSPNRVELNIDNTMTLKQTDIPKTMHKVEKPSDPLERTKIITCGKNIYLTFDCKTVKQISAAAMPKLDSEVNGGESTAPLLVSSDTNNQSVGKPVHQLSPFFTSSTLTNVTPTVLPLSCNESPTLIQNSSIPGKDLANLVLPVSEAVTNSSSSFLSSMTSVFTTCSTLNQSSLLSAIVNPSAVSAADSSHIPITTSSVHFGNSSTVKTLESNSDSNMSNNTVKDVMGPVPFRGNDLTLKSATKSLNFHSTDPSVLDVGSAAANLEDDTKTISTTDVVNAGKVLVSADILNESLSQVSSIIGDTATVPLSKKLLAPIMSTGRSTSSVASQLPTHKPNHVGVSNLLNNSSNPKLVNQVIPLVVNKVPVSVNQFLVPVSANQVTVPVSGNKLSLSLPANQVIHVSSSQSVKPISASLLTVPVTAGQIRLPFPVSQVPAQTSVSQLRAPVSTLQMSVPATSHLPVHTIPLSSNETTTTAVPCLANQGATDFIIQQIVPGSAGLQHQTIVFPTNVQNGKNAPIPSSVNVPLTLSSRQTLFTSPVNVLNQITIPQNQIPTSQGKITPSLALNAQQVAVTETKLLKPECVFLPQTGVSNYVSILGGVKKQKLNSESSFSSVMHDKIQDHGSQYQTVNPSKCEEKISENSSFTDVGGMDNKTANNVTVVTTSGVTMVSGHIQQSIEQPNLDIQMVFFGDAKPYKCDLCSAAFNRMGNYTRHRMIHTFNMKDSYRYKCDECGRLFLQRCDMKRHMLIHTKQEPYRCQDCGKGYIRRSDLVVHMRFHRKEKAFRCQRCSKEFFQSGDLNRHIRNVHLQSSLLTCGHCSRQFAKEATLIRHMQMKHRDIIMKSLQKKNETKDRDSDKAEDIGLTDEEQFGTAD